MQILLPGHRPSNEDAHTLDVTSLGEGHIAAAVFDGHAGEGCGIYVASNIMRVLTLNKSWKEYSKLESQTIKSKKVELIKTALVESFLNLDEEYGGTDNVKYGVDEVWCSPSLSRQTLHGPI